MPMLAGGTYDKLWINGAAFQPDPTGGKDKCVIYLQDPESQDTITDFLALHTEGSFKFACNRLKAYGWDPAEHGYRFEELNAEGDDFPMRGMNVGPVVIKEEEYQGKVRPKVAQVGDWTPPEKMSVADSASFSAALRAKYGIASSGKPAAKPKASNKLKTTPAATGSGSQSTGTDDEVPW